MDADAPLNTFLDRLESASLDLEDRLVALRLAINETRALLEQDVPLSQALERSHCPAARGAVTFSAQELIDLLHDYRAETVRRLVDDEGWSLTEIAEHSGNARQVVARLYHAAQEASREPPEAAARRSRPRAKVRMAHPDE